MRSFLLNMMSGDRTGRLLKHVPSAAAGGGGKTTEVLTGLWYANGVAVAHDEQSVLVVETMGFRVIRHWIAGPKAGASTTLIEHLPGFPDGITRSSDGNYWLCLVAPPTLLVKLLPLGSTNKIRGKIFSTGVGHCGFLHTYLAYCVHSNKFNVLSGTVRLRKHIKKTVYQSISTVLVPATPV